MKNLLLTLFSLFFLNWQTAFAVDCHADFTYAASGLTIAFEDNSTADPGPIYAWNWDFGDGSTSDSESPTHIYDEAGEYEVCLTIYAEGGCEHTECITIEITADGADCHANFEYGGDCLEQHFYNTSDVEGDIVSYTWYFGDGEESDDENPVHAYADAGIYTVCLIIETSTGCVTKTQSGDSFSSWTHADFRLTFENFNEYSPTTMPAPSTWKRCGGQAASCVRHVG